jgi:4-hydroxy-3-methylbut-2-enyl diphosphate reductase
MKVIRADVMGMCFGVRDALQIIADVPQPQHVTIHGELVHNEAVLTHLKTRGFRMVHESQRHELPVTETVLITAHGVSEAERRRLEAAGKQLVDTTCPLVARAHQAAQKLQAQGIMSWSSGAAATLRWRASLATFTASMSSRVPRK